MKKTLTLMAIAAMICFVACEKQEEEPAVEQEETVEQEAQEGNESSSEEGSESNSEGSEAEEGNNENSEAENESEGSEAEEEAEEEIIYEALGCTVYPAQGAKSAYKDTYLTLTFDSEPTLGSEGNITVYTAEGVQVDQIKMEDVAAEQATMVKSSTILTTAMDVIASGSTRYRVLYYDAVTVDGNTVTIKLHNNALSHSTSYYVTIDNGVISAGDFAGIAAEAWPFTTKAAPSSTANLTVGHGEGYDFYTVQGAITYLGKSTSSVTINIAEGTYEEQIYIRDCKNLTLSGAGVDKTILQYCNYNSLYNSVGGGTSTKPSLGGTFDQIGGRPVMLVESCDYFRIEDCSMINTYEGSREQAEYIYNNSTEKHHAYVNCLFHSRQDTICLKGYAWFYNCTVEGNVDYIWGSANVCLFENSTIRTIADSQYSRAYILQARCPAASDLGFVFYNCAIEGGDGVGSGTNYLARSSGSTEYYDNVTFVNCTMDASVPTLGWYENPAPNPSEASASAGWKEYNSNDAAQSGRSSYSCQLTEDEFNTYYKDRSTILSAANADSWYTE